MKKILIGGAGIVICALALGLSDLAAASPWLAERPITVGHRGTTVIADENTIASYTKAWEEGVDVIECDPWLTKDGVYVIMHDPTVDRTTDGQGKVSDLTLAQIKKLRTRSGQEVPALAEVLAFARDHGMGVYLDVKEPPQDGAALLVREIEAAVMVDRVIVGCWHVKTCKMVEARNPAISTCISWPWPAVTLGQARRIGADAVGTLAPLASAPMIKTAHRLRLRVITMPLNSPADLQKMKARGLDGLQSDDPRLLRPYGKKAGENPK